MGSTPREHQRENRTGQKKEQKRGGLGKITVRNYGKSLGKKGTRLGDRVRKRTSEGTSRTIAI